MPASTPQLPRQDPLIDVAREKMLEWDAKAVGEKRHGTVAIELTYIEGRRTLLRELIDLTTK